MTQEEKNLLFKDLSTRLPYGVILKCDSNVMMCIGPYTLDTITLDRIFNEHTEYVPFDIFKPYLFPLSSVTKEQVNELFNIFELDETLEDDYIKVNEVTGITFLLRNGFDVEEHLEKLMDWLNKYHFDYRGLIEKGLAIDATGKNIY